MKILKMLYLIVLSTVKSPFYNITLYLISDFDDEM